MKRIGILTGSWVPSGGWMVMPGPHLPIEGRPNVVDAQVSRQNKLHQVLRLCSIMTGFAVPGSGLSLCKPIAQAIMRAAPSIAFAIFGLLM